MHTQTKVGESRKKICNDLGKGKSSTMKIIINVVHVLVLFPLFVCLSNEPPSDSPCLFVRVFCAFVPCSFVPEFAKLIFPTYCFKSSCYRSTRRAVSVWDEDLPVVLTTLYLHVLLVVVFICTDLIITQSICL